MKKVISLLAMILLLAFTPNPNQQEKEYKASLTVNDWQILISNPDDVPANSRRAVIQKVVNQIQGQINADTLQKKK